MDAPQPGQRRGVLAATILGSSMAFIDGSVVNVALPAFQASLGATIADVQWIVEAYTLFLAALMLPGGALGDRLGRRRIFTIGVVVFAAGSIACSFAPNLAALIAFRAVQGVGAALLVPGSLSIISAVFPDRERGKAIGTWSAFTSITMIAGPLLGGAFIDHLSWRAIFFINAPLALLVLFLVARCVPESRGGEERAVDWPGAALATAGLGALVYALIESSTHGFAHALVALTLVAGVVLLAAFIVVEWRSRSPMMPLGLFRSAAFAGTNLLTLFLYGALAGGLFFVPMNLIELHGYSATAAGAAMTPSVLLLSLLSRWAGGLAERKGAKRFLVAGPVIAGIGFALFAAAGVDSRYWTGFLPAFLVLGFGMSLTVAPLTTTVMSSVPREHSGVASGVNNAISETAGLLMVAVMGIVMSSAFDPSLQGGLHGTTLEPAVRDAFLAGYRRVMIGCAVLAAFSAGAGWICLRSTVTPSPPPPR